jgi:hypothetical protein
MSTFVTKITAVSFVAKITSVSVAAVFVSIPVVVLFTNVTTGYHVYLAYQGYQLCNSYYC